MTGINGILAKKVDELKDLAAIHEDIKNNRND